MDEILIANFMIFQDAVDDGELRPGDRRRGLGRRPLLARASRAQEGQLAWFTDFVGFVPMPRAARARHS
jgi:hypothetical protein